MIRTFIFIYLFFLFNITHGFSQNNYVFELVTIKDRANFGDVYNLYEDSSGIIWMGIFGKGLAYYNGNGVTRYPLLHEEKFSNQNDIFIGFENFIYLNDGDGVRIFDPIAQEKPVKVLLPKKYKNLGTLSSIAITKENNDTYIWASLRLYEDSPITKYHLLISKNGETFTQLTNEPIITYGDPDIKSIFNTILVKNETSFIEYTSNGKKVNTYSLPDIPMATVNSFNWNIDSQGTIWLGGQCDLSDPKNSNSYNCEIWKKENKDSIFKKINYPNFDVFLIKHFKEKPYLRTINIIDDIPYKFYRETDSINFAVNLKTGKHLNISTFDKIGHKPGNIFNTIKSKSGIIWIGGSNGLSKLMPQPKAFKMLSPISKRSFIEDESGIIYGSVNWLNYVKPDKTISVISKIIAYYPKKDSLINFLTTNNTEGYWFQANYANGKVFHNSFQLDLKTGKSKKFKDIDKDFGHAYLSLIDRKGKLWKAHWGVPNIGIYDTISGKRLKIIEIPELVEKSIQLNDWYQRPSDGTIWLGTYGQGVFIFSEEGNLIKHLSRLASSEVVLNNNVVSGFYEDSKGNMWLGHGAGLSKISKNFSTIQHFTFNKKLPESRLVYSILPEDDDTFLWLSTSKGIFRFSTKTKVFQDFPLHPHMMNLEFNRTSFYKASNGQFYFGTSSSDSPTVSFFPKEVINAYNSLDTKKQEIIITTFSKYNAKAEKEIHHTKKLQAINEISLHPGDRYFSLSFLTSDYRSPKNNYYSYYLENYDETWNPVSRNNNLVKYENLPPGAYILHLRGSLIASNITKNQRDIKVIVYPYWYQTTFARVMVGLLLLGLGYLVYKYNLNAQYNKQENLRLQELTNLKTRLYTNITHEFRTPLTVIMGMNDVIHGFEKERNLIKHNAKSLLQLINQLLDLSKLDSGKIKLKLNKGDVVVFIKYLTESFFSMASEKRINLSFHSEIKSLVMDYDASKLQHIIYNLVTNAIKFTRPGGKVNVAIREVQLNLKTFLEITVKDTGIGISTNNLPYIFDRFYQIEEKNNRNHKTNQISGTGIGLALTKELIEIMNGEILVKSEVSWGTRFIVRLPCKISNNKTAKGIINTDIYSENKHTSVLKEINLKSDHLSSEKPLLLIIEDNNGIVAYIQSILNTSYEIIIAINGQEGIDMALERIPDIIITDVMMPEKNGYEVCEVLKNDEKTNHIPIIILTAKADVISKIEGLEKGADVYLSKPFEREELEINIKNLLELREKLQKRYSSKYIAYTKDMPINKGENKFIKKVQLFVDDNIQDSDLSVIKLSEYLGISQMQTYRKVKAVTGQPPVKFIRTLRLQKALTLLKSSELNISEIAYEVGFNDPNYFSRVFKKTFGFVPGDSRDTNT